MSDIFLGAGVILPKLPKVSVDERPVIYTGGCCLNNEVQGRTKRGGIGVYCATINYLNFSAPTRGKKSKYKAEIQAATKGVGLCKMYGYKKVHIKTDSEAVTKGMNELLPGWLASDWSNAPNYQDYKKLIDASAGVDVIYVIQHGAL